MKKISLLVLICMLCSVAAVFAADQKELVIGLSWNEKRHVLIQAWEDYMKMAAEQYGKEHGIKFTWIVNVADANPSHQASNIEDLLNQNVDVIVARPHDAAAIGASIKAAHDAGKKFVTFDRASSTRKPDAHVGADSYTQAYTTGEAFAKLLKEKGVQGQCIELMGDLRDQNAVNRSKGWKDAEAKFGAWKTVVQVPTEWNPEKFKTGSANSLKAHPEANCMFVASDFCFTAVESALEEAGKLKPTGEAGHMWIAAQDVNPLGYTAMLKGYIDVATSYDAYFHAVEVVKVLGKIAAGEDLGGKEFLVPGRVATPATLKSLDHMFAAEYKEE
jgi:ribose transport system substrate-binding protein